YTLSLHDALPIFVTVVSSAAGACANAPETAVSDAAPTRPATARVKLRWEIIDPLPCFLIRAPGAAHCPPPTAACARSARDAVMKLRICTLPSWQAYSKMPKSSSRCHSRRADQGS